MPPAARWAARKAARTAAVAADSFDDHTATPLPAAVSREADSLKVPPSEPSVPQPLEEQPSPSPTGLGVVQAAVGLATGESLSAKRDDVEAAAALTSSTPAEGQTDEEGSRQSHPVKDSSDSVGSGELVQPFGAFTRRGGGAYAGQYRERAANHGNGGVHYDPKNGERLEGPWITDWGLRRPVGKTAVAPSFDGLEGRHRDPWGPGEDWNGAGGSSSSISSSSNRRDPAIFSVTGPQAQGEQQQEDTHSHRHPAYCPGQFGKPRRGRVEVRQGQGIEEALAKIGAEAGKRQEEKFGAADRDGFTHHAAALGTGTGQDEGGGRGGEDQSEKREDPEQAPPTPARSGPMLGLSSLPARARLGDVNVAATHQGRHWTSTAPGFQVPKNSLEGGSTERSTTPSSATTAAQERNARRARRRAAQRGEGEELMLIPGGSGKIGEHPRKGGDTPGPRTGAAQSQSGCVVLVREDTRLHDNPALYTAANEYAWVVPLYVHDTADPAPWPLRGAALFWKHQSLAGHGKALRGCLGRLILRRGRYVEEVLDVLLGSKATALFFNRQLEPWYHTRDSDLERQVAELGFHVRTFNGLALHKEPWDLVEAPAVSREKAAVLGSRACSFEKAGAQHLQNGGVGGTRDPDECENDAGVSREDPLRILQGTPAPGSVGGGGKKAGLKTARPAPHLLTKYQSAPPPQAGEEEEETYGCPSSTSENPEMEQRAEEGSAPMASQDEEDQEHPGDDEEGIPAPLPTVRKLGVAPDKMPKEAREVLSLPLEALGYGRTAGRGFPWCPATLKEGGMSTTTQEFEKGGAKSAGSSWPQSNAVREEAKAPGDRDPPARRRRSPAEEAAGFFRVAGGSEGMMAKKDVDREDEDDWASELCRFWPFGEVGAMQRLEEFLNDVAACGHYQPPERYRADKPWTAILSPYLRAGDLSPRYAYSRAQEVLPFTLRKAFARRLFWKDGAYAQLYRWPTSPDESIRRQYEHERWGGTVASLRRWQRGRTGFPLVDAAMRQLWKVGWMPNYIRHITAQFLIEYLDLSWKHGFRWYDYTLVDSDVAINAMMWQMGGHSGLGAWNFVMHPVYAAKKVDPDGDYVRRWVPELRGLPKEYTHCPWEAPGALRLSASLLIAGDGGAAGTRNGNGAERKSSRFGGSSSSIRGMWMPGDDNLRSAGGEVSSRCYPERVIQDLRRARIAHATNVIEVRERFPEFVRSDGHEVLEIIGTGEQLSVRVRDDLKDNDPEKITLLMTADDARSSQRRKLVAAHGGGRIGLQHELLDAELRQGAARKGGHEIDDTLSGA